MRGNVDAKEAKMCTPNSVTPLHSYLLKSNININYSVFIIYMSSLMRHITATAPVSK
jgi:hypothetical protein